jgi:quinol monooxygenase YgiN
MYVITMEVDVSPDKAGAALAQLKKIVEHRKAKTGKDTRLLTRVTGVQGRVILIADYESLEAWERARADNAVDAEWRTLFSDAAKEGLFAAPLNLTLWAEG